ncbi:hypothetical protein JR316_0006607 [Psilocybe cubensis]|nr:hypothetical protein JR316_0006607 [Psilocybe cubensis]KAH9480010.1 hypothetical protein JR316_0006607 [Psilocybe cubensis]
MLALSQARSANGTPCQLHIESTTEDTFNQQWLIKSVPGRCDVYTLQNIRTGTYLDLNNGLVANATQVQGWEGLSATGIAGAGMQKQQWHIGQLYNYVPYDIFKNDELT